MVQSPGAARERLLRALPGRGVSGWKNGEFRDVSVVSVSEEEDVSGVNGFVVAPVVVTELVEMN